MKKTSSLFLALTILLIGGVIVTLSLSSLAQAQPHGRGPWVGPKSPWTYYHGDWFNNGKLHYYYGQKQGWAPYHAHPPGAVERPGNWYGEKWENWYRAHPNFRENFDASILTGVNTKLVTATMKIFITATIMVRGQVGNNLTMVGKKKNMNMANTDVREWWYRGLGA